MTEEEFVRLKVGDRIQRLPNPPRDTNHFVAVVHKRTSAHEFEFKITEILPGSAMDLRAGRIWKSGDYYSHLYQLIDQAPIQFPKSEPAVEQHIPGISRELIDFNAGRDLCM